MVEYFLAKENVAGSTPVVRYKIDTQKFLKLKRENKTY